MSSPFFGTWQNPVGAGVEKKKKRKGKGLLLGKNSPFNSIPILRENTQIGNRNN